MDGLMSLLAVSEFNGYKIKEWNIVQFSKLSGLLSTIAKQYQESNIDWSLFSGALSSTENTGMLTLSSKMMDSIQPFVQYAPQILSVSCGISEKQLEEMKYTDGVVLVLLVMKVNLEHLNGFFGKLAAQAGAARTEATTDSTLP